MTSLQRYIWIMMMMISSTCSGQSNSAVDAQKAANEALQNYAPQGILPGAGLFMKCTVDGRPWAADHLIPDPDTRSNNYHVTGSQGETTIAFFVYTPNLKPGSEHSFSESHAADFMTDDATAFYGGRTGKYTITKVDDKGFEGTFYFTANSVRNGSKKFEIKDGVFRFPWAKKK